MLLLGIHSIMYYAVEVGELYQKEGKGTSRFIRQKTIMAVITLLLEKRVCRYSNPEPHQFQSL